MKKITKKPAVKSAELSKVQELQQILKRVFPVARITIDEPTIKTGVWYVDVFLPDYYLTIAWKKTKGFGLVSNKNHVFGEGADEVYDTLDDALPRIVELIAGRRETIPPEAVRLKELREQRGMSQEELARRLGSKQASISRAEARSDFLLSTLKKHAEALGAKLVVKIVFPDSEMELKLD